MEESAELKLQLWFNVNILASPTVGSSQCWSSSSFPSFLPEWYLALLDLLKTFFSSQTLCHFCTTAENRQ